MDCSSGFIRRYKLFFNMLHDKVHLVEDTRAVSVCIFIQGLHLSTNVAPELFLCKNKQGIMQVVDYSQQWKIGV